MVNNYNLAKEIYGQVWLCDQQTAGLLRYAWDSAKVNVDNLPENKKNLSGLIVGGSFVAQDISSNDNVSRGTVARYDLDGPITKSGGLSHEGTAELAMQFRDAEADPNISSHFLYVNSGGGSVVAVKYLSEAFAERTKPMVAFVEDVCASAALWLSSYADVIYSRHADDMIGSIGTMIEFDGYAANTEDSNGVRHIRAYATPSVNKNGAFESALNDFDLSGLRSEMLDKSCADFISVMEANRPNITDAQKTGSIFCASDVVGTLIDHIGSYEDAMSHTEQLGNEFLNKSTNTIAMSKTITSLADLSAEYPEFIAQAIAEDRTAKQNEIATLIAAGEGAPVATLAQIAGGKGITADFVQAVGAEKVKLATSGKKDTAIQNAADGHADEGADAVGKKAEEEAKVTAKKAEDDMIASVNEKMLVK